VNTAEPRTPDARWAAALALLLAAAAQGEDDEALDREPGQAGVAENESTECDLGAGAVNL
jgi:hypothetical protein